MRVLVTGGAGFIGSHTVDALVERGHDVRVFDSLEPQVHGSPEWPGYLHAAAERIRGDVRDRDAVGGAVGDMDAVLHLAAAVGVGQSLYEIRRYVEVNSVGGATLLDVLANTRHRVRRVVVASSMSIYGEGAYRCAACGPVDAPPRGEGQLQARDWELHCPRCQADLAPAPTPESQPLRPPSIYAITKRDHEEMFLVMGRAYGIPTVALRYFNAYGPRQAVSNPYNGVVAIFAARLLSGHAPIIYEDGRQTRDFIHVRDVAAVNVAALEHPAVADEVLNVGSGRGASMLEVAGLLARGLGAPDAPEVPGRYRAGDVRHCVADTTRLVERLGVMPVVSLADGFEETVAWLRTQAATDRVDHAEAELRERGLLR